MKEKIFSALKAKIVDQAGKTSISDKTLNAYVEAIAAQITDESKIPEAITPFVAVLLEVQANINTVAASSSSAKEIALQSEIDKLKKPAGTEGAPDISALIKAGIEEAMKPLSEKLSGYESKEKLTARQSVIASKAKELGIPEWRQNEGFNISDDADDAGITATLTSVKKNLVTAGLESKNDGAFSLSTTADQNKELANQWASTLPDLNS